MHSSLLERLADIIRLADSALFRLVNTGCAHPVLDHAMIAATMLGMGVVQSGIALALVLAGLIWDRLDLRRAGYAGLVAFAFSGVGVQLAKMLWRRPRPLLSVFDVRTPDGPLFTHSFPSGHTTTAFAVAIALSFFLPRFRWLPIALAFATGVSRVYLGVHYPLDVIYAAALGTLIGVVSARWMRPSRTIEPGRKDSTAESAAV